MDSYGWEQTYMAVMVMMGDSSVEQKLSLIGQELVQINEDGNQLPDAGKILYREVMEMQQEWLDTKDLEHFDLGLFKDKLLELYVLVAVYTGH